MSTQNDLQSNKKQEDIFYWNVMLSCVEVKDWGWSNQPAAHERLTQASGGALYGPLRTNVPCPCGMHTRLTLARVGADDVVAWLRW